MTPLSQAGLVLLERKATSRRTRSPNPEISLWRGKSNHKFFGKIDPSHRPDYQRNDAFMASRDRSVDHAKRLYSILMGFAATLCVGNAFTAARDLAYSHESIVIALCVVSIFLLLMLPTYLISEQYMDDKYISMEPDAHNDLAMFIADISFPLILASVFVVIAQVFSGSPKMTSDSFQEAQFTFCFGVSIFCIIDVLLMILHYELKIHRSMNSPSGRAHAKNLWRLVKVDIFFLPIFVTAAILLHEKKSSVPAYIIFLALLLAQIVRFTMEMDSYESPLIQKNKPRNIYLGE